MLEIKNTSEIAIDATVCMLVYGSPGVGKSTLAASGPKPVIADLENGYKFFGKRGIDVPIAQVRDWGGLVEFFKLVKDSDYQTAVIDPLGELLSFLMDDLKRTNPDSFNSRGVPKIDAWGVLKEKFRRFIKAFRDCGKNVIFVAHSQEKQIDDGRVVMRPKLLGSMGEDLCSMLDLVGYLTANSQDRVLHFASSESYYSKDRTDMLGELKDPDFSKILHIIGRG